MVMLRYGKEEGRERGRANVRVNLELVRMQVGEDLLLPVLLSVGQVPLVSGRNHALVPRAGHDLREGRRTG